MADGTRVDPPTTGDERATLTAFLDYHRDTLAWKCEGLTAAQLRQRAIPPSALSLLGLVRHLAEVERGWFRKGVAGEQIDYRYCTDEDPEGDFERVDDASVDEAFAAWREECERSRAIIAAAPSLDATFVDRAVTRSLRWLLCHPPVFARKGAYERAHRTPFTRKRGWGGLGGRAGRRGRSR